METKQLRRIEGMMKKRVSKKAWDPRRLLGTGSKLLNLACSDTPDGGFLKGSYILIVGDTDAGKTWFSLSCMAEATLNPRFKDYRFIYDGGEYGALMDLEKYFGHEMARRFEQPPRGPSRFVEDFYYNADDAIEDGRPFIYVQDSMDVLEHTADEEQFQKKKKNARAIKKKKVTGSFSMDKPKTNSMLLRQLQSKLKPTGSILIIISQTRDNIGFGHATRTRAGGRALSFYADVEIWLKKIGRISKDYRGKKRLIGNKIEVEVNRTRLTGKKHKIHVPIFHSIGIDDLGSCIDFLVEEKHWKSTNGNIRVPEFKFKGTKDALIRRIEDRNLEKDLGDIVGEVWMDIAKATEVVRKPRYSKE